MAKAENIASIPLDKPETKSPDMVSLIAFVIATPGTKGIIEAMIIVSILLPKPILMEIIDKIEAKAAPIKLFMKKVILYLLILFMAIRTTKLTK